MALLICSAIFENQSWYQLPLKKLAITMHFWNFHKVRPAMTVDIPKQIILQHRLITETHVFNANVKKPIGMWYAAHTSKKILTLIFMTELCCPSGVRPTTRKLGMSQLHYCEIIQTTVSGITYCMQEFS
jgi:hypothetical protein